MCKIHQNVSTLHVIHLDSDIVCSILWYETGVIMGEEGLHDLLLLEYCKYGIPYEQDCNVTILLLLGKGAWSCDM